ncbi:MAG: LuxR family transcriptional regulator, maltose regulon positive regulatory protein [Clostridiales bacterium]|nr:LuxR family transcriptional regulator, maltose regulon positive regulatory protein [Clostridiales bacterium]
MEQDGGRFSLNTRYIKIPAIFKKLKKAEETKCPLYLSAPVGYGKTSALKYYYRKQSALWLSGQAGILSLKLPVNEIEAQTVIIDDITWITEEDSRRYINELIERGDKQVVMSGRARLPEWLKASCIHHPFLIADKKDLELDVFQTEKLLEAFQVKLPQEQIEEIRQDTKGHALCTLMVAYQMQNKESYTEVIREAARLDVFQYYNEALYEKWPEDLRKLLMAVSNFDSFDVELAEYVTELNQAANLLYTAMTIGDFLIKHENGVYEMLPMLRIYFLWKQSLGENREIQRGIFLRAALYYENNDRIEEALFYYNKAKDSKAVSRLLIRNARRHPGSGHYFETRKYYLSLPVEELEASPVLMAGISMLYSLLMQPEKSEYWYEKLSSFENTMDDKEEKKEARRRLIYLDIALPHRGSLSMVDILKKSAVFITDRKMTMPEFSVTSNLPSIMNGGKDFCEWSKSDRELARVMKKPVELVLQKWGAGLVNISLAESLFEKGEKDIYEIMTLLNSGYTKADMGGKIEMCFVATAVLCRIHICRNQLKVARVQLKEFAEKAKREGAGRLLPNINAMENWFDLLEGKTGEARSWLETEAPNECLEFYILNRYQYQMKVRTYLALEQYEEAANLIERLSVYYKEYSRTYMDMENEVLKAILQYRMKLGDWKDTLSQVLSEIEEYHFLYLIAKEGTAILPLLKEMELLPVKKSFQKELMDMAGEMALHYPNFLKKQEILTEELTDAEKQILHLYCQGVEPKKVCELCRFTYNTLKFHNRNLYRKLGVSNRQGAERKAGELGI